MTFEEKLKWVVHSFSIFRGFKKELSLLQVLTNTEGSDLFCLKQAVDNRETRDNMYQLIFDKTNNDLIRNLLLFHFKYQAERNKSDWVTVPMSDIDDTSMNSFRDKRFVKKKKKPVKYSLISKISKIFFI